MTVRYFLHAGLAAIQCALTLLACLGVFPTASHAQTSFAAVQLRGTITDATRATVPRATVTITNTATNISDKTTSDDQGRYIFNNLQPASYTLRVEAAGFRSAVRSGIVLRVGQQSDLDIELAVGDVATAVEVSASAPLLDSVTAALGQVVEKRYITEVPLFDREVMRLAYLAPGVTETQGDPFGGGSPTGFTGTNFSSSGQRTSTAEVRMDGGLASAPDGTGLGISFFYPWTQPSPEIVQEFKVQTSSFSSEYGSNGGTVINIVTMSGTNQFHGSGYWFGRRPELDANNFFANRQGQAKADYVKDIYGGSVGGPIFKQKTFFFFDHDRQRFQSPGTFRRTMPTALEKQGDFSQTFNADGSLRVIYNPFTVNPDTLDRLPFAGNKIPQELMDPVGSKLIAYFPEPTDAGDPITHLNNFTKNTTSNSPVKKYDLKIDHLFNTAHRVSGRFSKQFTSASPTKVYNTEGDPNNGSSNYDNYNSVVEYSWTVSPSLLWTSRGAINRFARSSSAGGFDLTQLGFPTYLGQVGGFPPVFPTIWVDGSQALGTWFGNWIEHNTQPSYGSSMTKVTGAHNIRFGFERKHFLGNYAAPGSPSGSFMFNNYGTEKNVFGFSSDQGHGIASLLLGFGDPYPWAGLDIQPASATASRDTGLYVQDDWRITQQLTVNLGLRYEWQSPYTERYNRVQFADWDADSGVDVPGLGRIKGVASFADPKRRHAIMDRNNWAPRLGFAYRIGQNTVVRGGAGVYYGLTQFQGEWLTAISFKKSSYWNSSLDGGITQFSKLSDPFPSGNFLPQGTKYGKLANWGFNAGGLVDSDPARNPEIYQWNLSVQQQLGNSMLFELAYSGNRSTHQPFSGMGTRDFITPAQREQWGTAGLSEQVPNPFKPLFVGPNAIFNEPDSVYTADTVARSRLLNPHPQFLGMGTKHDPPRASSRYNSMMFRFEKRFSHGLNFTGHYTYSRYTSDGGSNIGWLGNSPPLQDPFNLRAEHSVDGADTPHRLVFGGSYELPIGRGKMLGQNMHRVVDSIVGGWQVNGYLTMQAGNPMSIAMQSSRLAGGTQRPNLAGKPRSTASVQEVVDRKGNYFEASAFADPGDQRPGSAPRYIAELREPGAQQIDFSLFKQFKITERMSLQLRGEFFNFTNTPRFQIGSSSGYDGHYGEVQFGNPAFGTINGQRNSPRLIQMGARFLF
jgi:hypothetical protein